MTFNRRLGVLLDSPPLTDRHLVSYLRGAAGLSPLVDTAAKTDDADSDSPATIVSRTLVFPQGYLGFDCYKPPSLLQIPGTELLLAFANGRRTTSDAAADNIVMRQSTDAGVCIAMAFLCSLAELSPVGRRRHVGGRQDHHARGQHHLQSR